jgi:hypothetical protein
MAMLAAVRQLVLIARSRPGSFRCETSPAPSDDRAPAADKAGRRIGAEVLVAILPADRASMMIDYLLPLLKSGDYNVWASAAMALAKIPLRERTDEVISNLLPLLGESVPSVSISAAISLAVIGPGGASTTLTALKIIHVQEIAAAPALRAAARQLLFCGNHLTDSRNKTIRILQNRERTIRFLQNLV